MKEPGGGTSCWRRLLRTDVHPHDKRVRSHSKVNARKVAFAKTNSRGGTNGGTLSDNVVAKEPSPFFAHATERMSVVCALILLRGLLTVWGRHTGWQWFRPTLVGTQAVWWCGDDLREHTSAPDGRGVCEADAANARSRPRGDPARRHSGAQAGVAAMVHSPVRRRPPVRRSREVT